MKLTFLKGKKIPNGVILVIQFKVFISMYSKKPITKIKVFIYKKGAQYNYFEILPYCLISIF